MINNFDIYIMLNQLAMKISSAVDYFSIKVIKNERIFFEEKKQVLLYIDLCYIFSE